MKKYQKDFETVHGIKIGFMSFFTKAVAEALKLHPNVNSMIDGEDIVTPNYYDIAIAVQSDKGLVVPVIRNVETLSLADIERGIAGLAAKARAMMTGRAYVALDDVKSVALPVLRHRIMTNYIAEAEGVTPDDIVARLLNLIPRDGEK